MDRTAKDVRIRVTDATGSGGGRLRVVELRNPARRNCLSLAMLNAIRGALEGCSADYLVLTGAGHSFCSGLDLDELQSFGGKSEHLHKLAEIYDWLLGTRIPNLALVRGYAVGGGVGLAACAGKVVASTDFRARIPGGNLRDLAAIVIPSCRLRTQGKTPADFPWFDCELNAEQALHRGLVDQVVSLARLHEMVRSAREGTLGPEWFATPGQGLEAAARARTEIASLAKALTGVAR